MNVKGYAEKLDRKKQALKYELIKSDNEQNKYKIRRLQKSMSRNKKIGRNLNKKRKFKTKKQEITTWVH
ncbi:hypothetical protein M0R04_09860 [Candidatus Dojkabacteria bacterium]|jgi:hypothetical protein|nr:hypothetical protein [Candidatus Dojkabacteria bacterium]